MNKYAKEFFHRGLLFAGFGPVVAGVVLACVPAENLTGGQVLLAVVSTYLLAFIHAGASVFQQIEHWPLAKSLLCHFGSLYLAYSLCYLVNSWIPFDPVVLGIFTGIFVAVYFVVWGVVVLCLRAAGKALNRHIH
ncbi:MAG: DUF3021 domain-containing protein [Ruminococcaceae bacterium]|nr:DUF3021 domain-containing protein [Oscillospiraceae bacterium]